jgi:hypothetical protein
MISTFFAVYLTIAGVVTGDSLIRELKNDSFCQDAIKEVLLMNEVIAKQDPTKRLVAICAIQMN